jgi:hypothetical protein
MDKQQRMIMRLMAWERAKGELKSMLQTHVGDKEQFDRLSKAIKDFITDVEDNGKHE